MDNAQSVAYCGLWCGGCRTYLSSKCSGCKAGGGFSSCAVRICAAGKKYITCAQCESYRSCNKITNFISKIYAAIFKSDRVGSLTMIKEKGIDAFVARKKEAGKM